MNDVRNMKNFKAAREAYEIAEALDDLRWTNEEARKIHDSAFMNAMSLMDAIASEANCSYEDVLAKVRGL